MLFFANPFPEQGAHFVASWSTATLPWPRQVGQKLADLLKLMPVALPRSLSTNADVDRVGQLGGATAARPLQDHLL